MDETEARTMLRELDNARDVLRTLDVLGKSKDAPLKLGRRVYGKWGDHLVDVEVPDCLKDVFISQLEKHAKQTLSKYGKTR